MEGKSGSISGVRVLGRSRLQFRLTKRVKEGHGAAGASRTSARSSRGTPLDRTIDDPAGSGPYYVADRIPNQRVVLRRNLYYGGTARQRRRDGVDDRRDPSGLPACRRGRRLDLCSAVGAPRDAWRALAEKYGVNRPGGQVFASPSHGTWYFAFNHSRPAFKGPGQIPLKKAINFAIDRPALARTLGFLAVKRTDQMLPPALARAESIYPLGGADPGRHAAGTERAPEAEQARPLRVERPAHVAMADVLAFNLRQLGIELDVNTWIFDTVFEKATDTGRTVRHRPRRLDRRLSRPVGVLRRADRPHGSARSEPPSIRASCDAWGGEQKHDRGGAPPRLGGPRRRPDAQRPSVGAFSPTTRTGCSSQGAWGCFRHDPVPGVDITALCKRPMTRRLSLSLALPRCRDGARRRPGPAGSFGCAPRGVGEAPRGGTLRVGRTSTSTPSIRDFASRRDAWQIADASCAQAVRLPGQSGAGAEAQRSPRGRAIARPSRPTGAHTRSQLKGDVPLPHRRAGDRAELRRRVQSQRQDRWVSHACEAR